MTTAAERARAKPTMVRVSLELREQVKVAAAREKISMRVFVDRALEQALYVAGAN